MIKMNFEGLGFCFCFLEQGQELKVERTFLTEVKTYTDREAFDWNIFSTREEERTFNTAEKETNKIIILF